MADYGTTKALTILTRKDINSLQIREFPVPELGPHEVLIENVAVAQNMGDWKRIVFDAVPEVPWTIGSDVAGTIVRLGPAVTKFKVGDSVLSYVARFPGTARHGGYQTLTVAEEGLTAHLPPTMIGTIETIEASVDSITAPDGGTIASVLIMPSPTGQVIVAPEETTNKLSARGINLEPAWALHIDQPIVRERSFAVLGQLLQSGKLIPNRIKVMPGGLKGVHEGLRLTQGGKVSGEKLVYRIADTQF
ncbi:GroES-like protein [Auricularia subglabra TFB-10046 SS5]|nr:GroES-like protein [Auricularia subglabra TFB-10046 SS5]